MILAGLVVFIRQTDLDKVVRLLQVIGLGYCYIILVTLVAMLMGTVAWIYTFEKEAIAHLSFFKLFIIRLVGDQEV